MSMLAGSNFIASNTIEPSRFVSLDTTAGNLFHINQSSLNDTLIIGISQPGSFDPPGVNGALPDAARGGNIAAPPTPVTSSIASGALAGATLLSKITYTTGLGETTPSAEASQVLAASHVLGIAAPVSPPAGATGYNVYVTSGATGTETLQNTTPLGLTQAYQEPNTGLVAGGRAPPTVNTSVFPPSPTTLQVYGPGDVGLLQVGAGGITAGDWLESDANGNGITASLSATTAVYYGAKALETANVGELARVVVILGAITGT